MDSRFTVELYLDKHGYMVGKIRLPEYRPIVIEGLNEVINQFAKKLDISHHEVLNLLVQQQRNATGE